MLRTPFARLLTISVLIPSSLTAPCPPYPYTNSTVNTTTVTLPPPWTPPKIPVCETAYPSELQNMNSRYPALELSPTRWFMILRQGDDAFQEATQVQFTNLPAAPVLSNSSSDSTPDVECRLELVLPEPNFTHISGLFPVFNVYQVDREAGSRATWEMYEGARGAPV